MERKLVLCAAALVAVSCGVLGTPTPLVVRETVQVEVTRIVEVTGTSVPPTATPRLAFFEDFSGGADGWVLPSAPGIVAGIEDGRMRIELVDAGVFDHLTHPELNDLVDFDLSFDATYLSGPPQAAIGVYIDLRSGGDAIAAFLTADGRLYLGRNANGVPQDIVEWLPIEGFRPDLSPCRVRFRRVGSQLSVYANDLLLASLPLDLPGGGVISVFFQTWETGGAVWELDNVELHIP